MDDKHDDYKQNYSSKEEINPTENQPQMDHKYENIYESKVLSGFKDKHQIGKPKEDAPNNMLMSLIKNNRDSIESTYASNRNSSVFNGLLRNESSNPIFKWALGPENEAQEKKDEEWENHFLSQSLRIMKRPEQPILERRLSKHVLKLHEEMGPITPEEIKKHRSPSMENQPADSPFLSDEDDTYYIGQWKNQDRHGWGTLVSKCGGIYEGVFRDNKPNGYGRLINHEREWYVGYWKNGKKNGEGESNMCNEPAIYKGNFENDDINGKGTMVYQDNVKYIGGFINGVKDGEGIEYHPDGTLKYKGAYKDGKFHSLNKECELNLNSGHSYKGYFQDGKYHKKGLLKLGKTDYYKGEFQNGKMHGQGEYHSLDWSTYKGSWSYGKKCGFGNQKWANGDSYKGNFKDDEYFGQGFLKRSNDDWFKGNFLEGRFINGKGRLTDANGSIFTGNFQKGRKHGVGIETSAEEKGGNVLSVQVTYRYSIQETTVPVKSGNSVRCEIF